MTGDKARELAALLLLAPCVAAAAVALLRAARERSLRALIVPAGFALLCLTGLQAWPAGADPFRFPILAARIAAPALVLAGWLAAPRFPRLFDRAVRAFALASALAVTAYALRVLISYRPDIGDVDFFSYVAFARDALDGVTSTAAQRLVYFPGTYLFWELALATTHRSLAGLQWSYTAVLLLNGVLCGALVWRSARSWTWALFCAAAQLLLAIDLGGSGGVTEPVAVLFPLAAILLWSGAPLRGRRGLWLAAALGLGFGAAIYCKQQAGLLAPGFAALLLLRARSGRALGGASSAPAARDEWRALLSVPLFSLLTLAALFWLHGGLPALRGGLLLVSSYYRSGGFLENLAAARHAVWPLPWLALAAGLFVLLSRRDREEPWLRCAALLLGCGFTALYQYRTRAFLHYALLALPLLIAGAALVAQALCHRLAARRPALARAAAPALILLATAWLGGRDGDFGLPSRPKALPFFSLALDHRPLREWPYGHPAQAELEALRPRLPPGEGAFVVSPIHNAAHFLLGTRSPGWPQAYFWGPPAPGDAERAVRHPLVRLVVVRRDLPSELSGEVAGPAGAAAAVALLPALGYHAIYSSPGLAVFQR